MLTPCDSFDNLLPRSIRAIQCGTLGGPFTGTITDAGLLYTTLTTSNGPIRLPNSGLLAAANGPATDPPHDFAQPIDADR